MARKVNRLSPRGVDTLTRPGMHADGGGLYLKVDQAGAKRWTLLYRWQGARREMGLGRLQDVGLAGARQKAAAVRAQIDAGIDPISARRAQEAAKQRAIPTFGEMAESYLTSQKPTFRNPKHVAQWAMTLSVQRDDAGAFRSTGYCIRLRSKPVNQIGTEDVLAVLKPLWLNKSETASRLRGRIERVLDAARALELRTGENPARWRGHLDTLLSKRPKLTRGHHAAMPYKDVPAFIAKLAQHKGMGALGLEFLILVAGRTGEVLGARGAEIDMAGSVWVIPASRMKAGREHRVPLVGRALDIVRTQVELFGDGLLFPGQGGKVEMSNATLAKALRTAGGGDFTPHGFRSAFRDWASEETSFAGAIAEAALAHVTGDETERAYRRGDVLEKRRKLMQAWERYCTSRPAAKSNVVPIGKAARAGTERPRLG
jgi:integrase